MQGGGRLLGTVRDVWRGALPLRLTYWAFGVGGNMGFLAALILGYALLGAAALPALWVVYAVSLAWFVWIFGGIWRAAAHYRGPPMRARLARAGVCLGIPRMAAEAVLLAAAGA